MSFQNPINMQMLSEACTVPVFSLVHSVTFPALPCAGPASRRPRAPGKALLSEPGLGGQTADKTDTRRRTRQSGRAAGEGSGSIIF